MSKHEKWSSLAGQPLARISQLVTGAPDRKPGSARGLISIAKDFDAPMPDFQQALEE
jgi:hypothetical protein